MVLPIAPGELQTLSMRSVEWSDDRLSVVHLSVREMR